MTGLFALDTLVERLRLYVARRELKPEAFALLEQTLQRGELPRGEADRVTGLRERTARDLLGSLVSDGILGSDTPKGLVSPLRSPPGRDRVSVPQPLSGDVTGMSVAESARSAARGASEDGASCALNDDDRK